MGNTLFILGLQGYLGLNTSRVLVDISEEKKFFETKNKW